MNFCIQINGQQSDIGEMQGVYEELSWDLTASVGERVECTGGTVPLPPPDPENFVAGGEVTPEIKLAWLAAQFPAHWLENQKALLADRFSFSPRLRAEPVSVPV